MKKRWIAALALTGLLLTTGAYAESTPEAAAAPVQAETTAEPQHNLTVTTKYRYSSASTATSASAKSRISITCTPTTTANTA